MKLNLLSKMTSVGRTLLFATLALISAGAVQAQSGTNFFNNTISGVNLGDTSGGTTLGHKGWAIFALSGGVTITDPVATYGDPLSYDVYGNVAIAGTGALSMTASWIRGGITVQNNSQVTPSGAPFYTGARTVDATFGTPVTGAVAQATAASNAAATATGAALTGLAFTGAINASSTSYSLTAAASITGATNATYVINLQDMLLSGAAAQLTLSGTNTTNFIFNISRFLTLSNQAKIILNPLSTITEANVLYNVKSSTPQYDVGLSGGSELHGIILGPTRNVKLTGGSSVIGEIIAKGVSLSGVSKIINPYTSP